MGVPPLGSQGAAVILHRNVSASLSGGTGGTSDRWDCTPTPACQAATWSFIHACRGEESPTCTWETADLSPSDVGIWSFTVYMHVGLWVKWNRKRGGLSVSVFQHVQPICMSTSCSPSSPPQHVPKDHVVQGSESTRSLSVSCLTCIINKGRRHMPLWLVLELKPFAWGGDAPGTCELWFSLLVSHLLFSCWKCSEKECLVKGLYPNIWSLRNQSGFKPRNYLDRLLSAWLVLVQEEENQIDVDISLPKGAQERRQVDRWKQQQSRQTALRRGCLLCCLKWWWPVR